MKLLKQGYLHEKINKTDEVSIAIKYNKEL